MRSQLIAGADAGDETKRAHVNDLGLAQFAPLGPFFDRHGELDEGAQRRGRVELELRQVSKLA